MTGLETFRLPTADSQFDPVEKNAFVVPSPRSWRDGELPLRLMRDLTINSLRLLAISVRYTLSSGSSNARRESTDMGDFDRQIVTLRHWRADILQDLEDFKYGVRWYRNDEDITYELIARSRQKLKDIDALIVAYDSRNHFPG